MRKDTINDTLFSIPQKFFIFVADLKQFLPILFLIALFWQPCYQTGYIGYWEINKENIIKTECINRFKPMMHCNGKCQLYRQLKKAADEEAENNKLPMAVLKLKTPDTFIITTTTWQEPVFATVNLVPGFAYTDAGLDKGYGNILYQPPQV